MAITSLEFMVLSSLREHGTLIGRPTVLELGESNWYGDVPIDQLETAIRRLVGDPAERDRHLARLHAAVNMPDKSQLYEIARVFFEAVVQAGEYAAVDPGTPGSVYRFDLNLPVPIDRQFEVVLNIGTAEHIFNVFQFFKTAHERTAPGGLMMHSAPFTGWLDHGFFSFHPTFFFDLARANGYEILSFVIARLKPFEYVQVRDHDHVPHLIQTGRIPAGSHINVVFRKGAETDFTVPVQGYYAGTLSKVSQRSWHELR